jgi:hypothetical protein
MWEWQVQLTIGRQRHVQSLSDTGELDSKVRIVTTNTDLDLRRSHDNAIETSASVHEADLHDTKLGRTHSGTTEVIVEKRIERASRCRKRRAPVANEVLAWNLTQCAINVQRHSELDGWIGVAQRVMRDETGIVTDVLVDVFNESKATVLTNDLGPTLRIARLEPVAYVANTNCPRRKRVVRVGPRFFFSPR